jgi:hypothetical protein
MGEKKSEERRGDKAQRGRRYKARGPEREREA